MACPAGQSRSAWSRTGTADRGVVPAVVLADGGPGREFDVLRSLLEEALGVATVRIGTPHRAAVSLRLEDGVLTVAGGPIRPVVAWVRHSAAGAVYRHATRTGGTAGIDLPAAGCWERMLDLLAAEADMALPGAAPGLARQLRDARRYGVRVPRTVASTDVDDAIRQLAVGKAVVKAPDARLWQRASEVRSGFVPEIVGAGDGNPAWMDGSVPAIVQEYIDHERELRVYATNGGRFAYQVDKPTPGSIWTDPNRVTVRPVACPPRLAEITSVLCRQWGLRYGAFDFLLTPDEPVFLEANADGDWLWFERKAGGNPVSFLVATMVAELYARIWRSKVV